jgi:hypothetical protein
MCVLQSSTNKSKDFILCLIFLSLNYYKKQLFLFVPFFDNEHIFKVDHSIIINKEKNIEIYSSSIKIN